MSCPHGNHPDACDICDEVAAAYNSGVEHTKREWIGLTNDELWQMVNDCVIGGDLHAIKYARAIEAAHGIRKKT